MAIATEAEPIAVRARRRLRRLRTERGLTLQEVAARANLDVSTLSRREVGKRRLALDHVPVLAAALGVSTDDLLAPEKPADPRIRAKPRRTGDGLTLWPLTRDGPAAGPRAYKVHVHADRREPPAELPVHGGRDWIYVLSGRLRLLLGDQDLTIEPGEAVDFTTWTPHWFGAVDERVELILIVGPEGERQHLQP